MHVPRALTVIFVYQSTNTKDKIQSTKTSSLTPISPYLLVVPTDRFINQRKNAWQRLEDLLKLLDAASLRRLRTRRSS